MAIPAGAIIMWPGTAASIPSGWSRVPSLDGRYVKGTAAGVDPDVTGGAATHTHTDTHSAHSIAAHTHVGGTSGNNAGDPESSNRVGSSTSREGLHTHGLGTTSSNAGSFQAGMVGTWQAGSSDPAFIQVIWIQSDGTPTGFPASSWAFWNNSGALPTNWSNPAGARNAFPKGAAAAGDGGGTGGGGAHAHVANAHTHNVGSHTHTGTSAASTLTAYGTAHTGTLLAHTHTYTTGGSSSTSGSATSANSGSTTYEPSWAKLAVVQNDTGANSVLPRHVAVWLGLLSAIPIGWLLCDGTNSTVDMRGKFVKGANGIGEIGATGGAAGHAHADPATHTHAYDHTHAVALDGNGNTGQVEYVGSGSIYVVLAGHSHASGVNTAATGTSGALAQTAPSTADTQPPFRTVAFIMFTVSLAVTIDTPADQAVLDVPSFTVGWSLAYDPAGDPPVQNDFRVRIYADDQVEVVYDSGAVASATQQHIVPSGYLVNDSTYYIQVEVTDEDGLFGISPLREVTTDWAPPAQITGLTAVQIGG